MYHEESHMTDWTLGHAHCLNMHHYELHAIIDTVKRQLILFSHDGSHRDTAIEYLRLKDKMELIGRSEHLVGAMIFFDADSATGASDKRWNVEASIGYSSMQSDEKLRIKNTRETLLEAEKILKYYFAHAKLSHGTIEHVKVQITFRQ